MADTIQDSGLDAFVGKQVRDYKIHKMIGQGKFSYVYKAERQRDKKPVALKLLKIFDMNDSTQREKCMKEVKLLEKLQHPFVIRYLESFIEDNEMFIIVEWAEKGDLKNLIRSSRARDSFLEERKVWTYIWQIASALQHMQQMRVMHRDLKPANIFIDSDDNLKVGDLGLGRDFTSQTMEAFSRVGTPLYMSPEVLQNNGYDFKSDVWSLGCISYEFCALISPFKDEEKKMSLLDLFKRINAGIYNPISASRYSSELRYLVDSMLQVDPTKRVGVDDVVKYCQQQLAIINESSDSTKKKRQLMDPALIMDDVYEKLHLLDYLTLYCKVRNKKPLARTYFALKSPTDKVEVQVQNMFDLCYWLISLSGLGTSASKGRGSSQTNKAAVVPSFQSFRTRDAAIEQLLKDIKKVKISLPDNFSHKQILEGHGEAVCYIINELTNRELIRRKFKFLTPNIHSDEDQFLDEDIDTDDHRLGQTDEADVSMMQTLKNTNKKAYFTLLDKQTEKEHNDELNQFIGHPGGITNVSTKETTLANPHKMLDVNTLETSVDPETWLQEVDRIKNRLKLQVSDLQPVDELEEAALRREEFVKNAKVVQEFSDANGRTVVEDAIDYWTSELSKIKEGEKQLTLAKSNQLQLVSQLSKAKQILHDELVRVTTATDTKLQSVDSLEMRLSEKQEEIDLRQQDQVSPETHISSLKKSIVELKSEIKQMSLMEGVSRTVIQNAQVKQSKERFEKKLKFGSIAFIEEEKKEKYTDDYDSDFE